MLFPERVAKFVPGRSGSIEIPSTSSVIAIEKTPSLKATMRENSTSCSSRS